MPHHFIGRCGVGQEAEAGRVGRSLGFHRKGRGGGRVSSLKGSGCSSSASQLQDTLGGSGPGQQPKRECLYQALQTSKA